MALDYGVIYKYVKKLSVEKVNESAAGIRKPE